MKVRKDLNMMEIENLIKIIDAVSESELTGLKYEEDDVKIHLTKKQGKVPVSYTHLMISLLFCLKLCLYL